MIMAPSPRRPSTVAAACSIVLFLLAQAPFRPAAAVSDEPSAGSATKGRLRDLLSYSIEELMNVEVTTAARKPVKLSDATSAVFVVSKEDLRRSGATTVPDALRMVPGLEVARISANQWAVSSRGFNGRFANKLLVLVDGRTVYTPSFSGVYWEVQDLLLEDIERIEVVRGPGAALWGANAVNGVINIITKPAAATAGGLLTAAAGSEERLMTGLRYGDRVGDTGQYRVYAKAFERDGSVDSFGQDFGDDGRQVRGGFRADWAPNATDAMTVQGDSYSGIAGQMIKIPTLSPPYRKILTDEARVSGGNLLGRWQRSFSPRSDLRLQAYYDWTDRREATHAERMDTVDLEAAHRFDAGGRQEILWGLGYRSTIDDVRGTFSIATDPETRRLGLASAFFQDEIRAVEDRLLFTVGAKVEHNDYTGTEVQPSVRMLWSPADEHRIWSAVSRAVRTPSRLETDAQANSFVYPDPASGEATVIRISGTDDFLAEDLVAYEIGYRFLPAREFSLDLAAFFNSYDHLRSGEPGAPFPEASPPPPHQVQPYTTDNLMNARTYGIEAAADVRLLPWWTVNLAYTFLEMDLHPDHGSQDLLSEHAEDESPHHQASVRSLMNLRRNLELDLWLRYVDNLPYLLVRQYYTLDARLGWWPRPDLEIVLAGQNLLDERHAEFAREIFYVQSEIQRSAYLKVVWSF